MGVMARRAYPTVLAVLDESFTRMEALEAHAIRAGRDHLTCGEQSAWDKLHRGVIVNQMSFMKFVVALIFSMGDRRPDTRSVRPAGASDQPAPATSAWARLPVLARAP